MNHVCKTVLFVVGALACAQMVAAPFVTPNMIKRNGLTDEQYEMLWKMGRSPAIEPAAARDWIFRAGRYQNVTNWLDICGSSNNFAKLSYKLQGDNFELEETNKVVVSENHELWRTNSIVVAENEVLVETNAVLEVSAEKAWKVEKAADKAKKKDQKNFEKWVKDTEKAKSKSSTEMAEFYDSVLELAHAYEEAN